MSSNPAWRNTFRNSASTPASVAGAISTLSIFPSRFLRVCRGCTMSRWRKCTFRGKSVQGEAHTLGPFAQSRLGLPIALDGCFERDLLEPNDLAGAQLAEQVEVGL